MGKRFGHLPPITDEQETRIQAGIAADPDNPELTPDKLAELRPLSEILPELAAAIRRARGRPPEPMPKKQVTVRLDADVIDRLKADGAGWQTRMNATLRQGLGLSGTENLPKQKRS